MSCLDVCPWICVYECCLSKCTVDAALIVVIVWNQRWRSWKQSPWYNRTGWLGVEHQFTHLPESKHKNPKNWTLTKEDQSGMLRVQWAFLGETTVNYGSVTNQRGRGKAEFAPQLELDVGIRAKRKQSTGGCRLSSQRNLIFLLLREGGCSVAGWVVALRSANTPFNTSQSRNQTHGCPTLTQPHWYVLGWIIKWQCYYWFLWKSSMYLLCKHYCIWVRF